MRRRKMGIILGTAAALISAASCFYFIEADQRPDRGVDNPMVWLVAMTVLLPGGTAARLLRDTLPFSVDFASLFTLCVVAMNTFFWLAIGSASDRLRETGNAKERVRKAMRRLVPSPDMVYRGWVFVLEVLERMAIGSLVSTGSFWLAYRFSPHVRGVLSGLVPAPSHVALPIGLLWLSVKLALAALVACLLAGALCRVFYLTRFVYRLARAVGTALMLGIPTICLTGLIVKGAFPQLAYTSSCLLGLIATACLFSCCFEYMEMLLPEAGAFLKRAASGQDARADDPTMESDRSEDRRRRTTRSCDSTDAGARYAVVLGLKGKMTFPAIRERYLELVRQYHPDKVQHLGAKLRDTAEREMKDINEAYEYFKRKHEEHKTGG